MADDYYAILGVEKDATSQDIKRAFRQIARECHPDRSGGDPASEERFKKSRLAYETLMDPVTRARYDRRGQRRMKPGESFFDAFYRHTGGGGEPPPKQATTVTGQARPGANPTGRRRRAHDPGNDVSLDDLFNDFGFGGGRVDPGSRGQPRRDPPPPSGRPSPGDDVHIDLDVPAAIAATGGSVTAVYYRMQRADSWRPGMGDPGLVRVQDIADVRVIPGTRTGEVVREKGQGNAGPHGGPYGDLVARIRVSATRQAPPPSTPPPHASPPPSGHGRDPSTAGSGPSASADGARHEVTLDITVVEALLGGRVPLETSHGSVRLSIPPGSSGGTRLRLKGKGPTGSGGAPSDLYVTLRIVVPSSLDAESRQHIEAFARLNPDLAR